MLFIAGLRGVWVRVAVNAAGVADSVSVWDGVRVGATVVVGVGVSVAVPGAVRGMMDAWVAVGDGVAVYWRIGKRCPPANQKAPTNKARSATPEML